MTQECTQCRQPLREGAAFCARCGAPAASADADGGGGQAATTTCPHCLQANRNDARFCRNCGGVLETASMFVSPVTSTVTQTIVPPPVEPPGVATPSPPAGRGTEVIIWASVAVILVVVAVVIVVSRRTATSPRTATPTTTASIVDTANPTTSVTSAATTAAPTIAGSDPQSVATQLTALLEQSKSARNLVVAATQNVGACQETPGQGIQEVQQAVTIRSDTISSVDSLPMAALQGGPEMARLLVQALQASLSADTGFIGWMNDIASSGCPVATATDSSYQAAAAASQQATAAKQQFLALWNPVAQQYGLATFTEADL